MQILILGAGYATRLYPLTLNQPKPLLPVAGKPMVNHVLDNLAPISGIERVCVVTNEKFTPHFQKWGEEYHSKNPKFPVTILNDHSTDDSNKLGAIGDIHLFITQENVNTDIIVVAGDNLFSQSLENFGEFVKQKNAPVLGVYDTGKVEDAIAKKFGWVTADSEGKITAFVEKPDKQPDHSHIALGLYYYPAHSLSFIKQYIAEGNNPDQPGRLIQWLYQKTPVYTWRVPGIWYDIGSKEMLEEANRIFSQI